VNLISPVPPDLIPAYQARGIMTVVQQFPFERWTGDVTPANIQKYAQQLLDTLNGLDNNARPFFRAIGGAAAELEAISSERWNNSQERIYVDLYAIFKALTAASSEDTVRGELTRDKFVQTKGAILRIINELRLFQFLRANPEYQDAKFVNFGAALNETEVRPAAVVDGDVRLLELAPRARQLQSRRDIGLTGTKITVEHLGGGRMGGRNDEFSPEDMLDSNRDSFWAEMVLSEAPIHQDYGPSGDAGLGTLFEVHGPICHVYLELPKASVANTLRLLPFGEFPVRVIDIAYKEAIGQTQWTTLPNFMVEDPTLDWIEVNFEPRTIASLRVTLAQENPRLNTYHMPEKLVRNGLIWQQIGRSRSSELLTEIALSDEEKDVIQADPSELMRLQAIADFREFLDAENIRGGRDYQVDLGRKTARAGAKAAAKADPAQANEVISMTEGAPQATPPKTVALKVYEYVYGIRELALQYNLYQPLGTYKSQKFATGASVLEVSLTTEERLPVSNDGLGKFNKTSIEWNVEVGRDRRYPIAPRNWREDGVITVPDEFIQFDRLTRQGVTRLPAGDLSAVLRMNGHRVPLSAFTTEYYTPGGPEELPFLPETGGTNPGFLNPSGPPAFRSNMLLVTITDDAWFDANAVYTIRYTASDTADVIDIDSDLDSLDLPKPEIFQRTTRDGQILLKSYPFVDYRIINSELWTKVEDEAKWIFTPTNQNQLNGTVTVNNGSTTVTGAATGWTGDGPFVFKVVGDPGVYFATRTGPTSLTLSKPYQGESGSGKAYVLGEYYASDGKVFAFERSSYEPVKVYVNDVRAKNMTDYESFEHQAFTDVPRTGRQIQFIHAGNILYFNRPIEGSKIEVHYSWLTQYVCALATLRCNIPVRTVLTPQINSFRIELKTSKL